MLKIFYNLGDLDFRQLMDVYEETNLTKGREDYPKEPEGLRLLFAEQDFYQYLELFFQSPDAVYAVWDEEGRYRSALRLERYKDGFLVTALETLPAARGLGCGKCLLSSVVDFIQKPLYSHIRKDNVSSLAVHQKCGFAIISHEATFLDGSAQKDYYTMKLTKTDPVA